MTAIHNSQKPQRVFLNDEELHEVRSIGMSVQPFTAKTVTIEMFVDSVIVDTVGDVRITTFQRKKESHEKI